jgi:hypothetical protein
MDKPSAILLSKCESPYAGIFIVGVCTQINKYINTKSSKVES